MTSSLLTTVCTPCSLGAYYRVYYSNCLPLGASTQCTCCSSVGIGSKRKDLVCAYTTLTPRACAYIPLDNRLTWSASPHDQHTAAVRSGSSVCSGPWSTRLIDNPRSGSEWDRSEGVFARVSNHVFHSVGSVGALAKRLIGDAQRHGRLEKDRGGVVGGGESQRRPEIRRSPYFSRRLPKTPSTLTPPCGS